VILLITNDDGYDARGLQEFAEVMSSCADVFVVAPDSVRSCCSHGVTTADELHIRNVSNRHWTVSGTPADCVRVGLKWLGIRPDWVLSGVNEGGNLGVDIHYSGTVAGAREGRLLGFPSMAFSQYLRRELPRDWKRTALRARSAFGRIRQLDLADREFWNVNLPVDTSAEMDLELSHCEPEPDMLPFEYESLNGSKDLQQRAEYEQVIYRSNYQSRPRGPLSDVDHCFAGRIAVSRLHLRLSASDPGSAT
jgi:5'-nucleotidase